LTRSVQFRTVFFKLAPVVGRYHLLLIIISVVAMATTSVNHLFCRPTGSSGVTPLPCTGFYEVSTENPLVIGLE